MFINAKPRFVSNGFETFVPIQRAESLHQRLVEMTNNDVNAWSVYRPAAPSAADSWDHHLDDFGNNENFQKVQSLYGGYLPNVVPSSQSQAIDFRTVSYTTASQGQGQHNRSPITYQDSPSTMDCFQQPSPMLGHDYSQYSLIRGRGSFVEFAKARHGLEDFKYQPTDSATNSFAPAPSSGISTTSYSEDTSNFSLSLDMNRTSPETVCNTYSPRTAPAIPQIQVSSVPENVNQVKARADWWPGTSRSTKDQDQRGHDLAMNFDGFPRHQSERQTPPYSNQWNTASTPASKWTLQSNDSSTISPKALTLQTSFASLASCESSQGSMMGLSDASTTASMADGMGDRSSPENLVVVEPQEPSRQQRQLLPDSRPISRRIVPVLPSNNFPLSRSTRKRSLKAIESQSHGQSSSPPRPLAPAANSEVHKSRDERSYTPTPERDESESADPEEVSEPAWKQSLATLQATHHRDAKDDFLIKAKLAGMSYKDVRRLGNFTEAESTLRGRFRTLTKHKAARVRKPEWNENDIQLLRKAVRKFLKIQSAKSKSKSKAKPTSTSTGKIPWKLVAEYIANNGGSYHFGNATCRKRWDELQKSV